jgi:hypothetical protein
MSDLRGCRTVVRLTTRGASISELTRRPAFEHVRRLHQVIIDRDHRVVDHTWLRIGKKLDRMPTIRLYLGLHHFVLTSSVP